MPNVTFYTFSKASNSTKQPTGAGRTLSCTFLGAVSLTDPGIRIQTIEDPTAYNYAYIPDFNRYYFVTNWTIYHGQWTGTLKCDSFASFRDEIGESSQYILRCSAERNGFITDNLYPATDQITVQTAQFSGKPFWQDLVNGEYVVGIVGAGENGMQMGAITYYAMSPIAFSMFAEQLFSEDAWLELEGDPVRIPVVEVAGDYNNFKSSVSYQEVPASMATLKTEFNPAQYIVSCKWFPFVPTATGGGSSVKLGWWTINAGVESIAGVYEQSYTCTIPAHPQIARGYYLHMPPYSRYTLHFPPFGDIPLDGSYFVTDATLTATVRVDMISGEGALILSTPTGGQFLRTSAQIGVDISVGQLASQAITKGISSIGGVVGAVSDALTTDIGGAIKNAASAVGDAFSAMLPQVTVQGGNGSRAHYGMTPYLTSQFLTVVPEDPEHYGSPLCDIRQISAIPGFIMCGNPELEIPATLGEVNEILNGMRSGFFYE